MHYAIHSIAMHSLTQDCKGPQRTAKENYGLGCRKLAPIEINGALYSNACQDSSKLGHSLQCLFCVCVVVTSHWFALSKFVFELWNENNCYVISIIVTTTYRLSTVKLGPTDAHSSVCNQQRLLHALTTYLFT